MFGYIYLTKNLVNNKVYIGKHKSDKYDSKYYGSGLILKKAIKKYGINNFTNELIDKADSLEELNEKEKYYISKYKEEYGDKCYNISNGGDGGDNIHCKSPEEIEDFIKKITIINREKWNNKSEKEKEDFIKKMTSINRERCNTDDFKKKISKASHNRYLNENERIEQSIRIKKAWSNPILIEQQRERLLEYYKNNKVTRDKLYKPCIFELNGEIKEFESVKSLRQFLIDEFNYNPDRRTFAKLMKDGANRKPFIPYHKNKLEILKGMLIYYKQDKSVETMGDECSPVGVEIDTTSKCKT